MNVVTAEQMREMDRRAMTEFGIPGVVLMENAGRAIVDVMQREYGTLKGKRIAIFCGSGNNGGDGFVIARHLHLAGAFPTVWMVGRYENLKGEALANCDILHKLKIPVCGLLPGTPISASLVNDTDFIVDAMLGTGAKGAPRDEYAAAIKKINEAGCPVIAVDIPSGVDADTGAVPGGAIRATHTVTFAYPKTGLYLFPGAEYVGKLHVADIGFDWEQLHIATPYRVFNPTMKGRLLKKRAAESNKGDYGHVGIIAGSRGMVGAPALVARAAQRTGAGLVTVLAPACAQPTIGAKLDEQMTVPLPDAEGALSEAAFETIAKAAERFTVLCIGPGLTTAPEAVAVVQRLIRELSKPMIVDADGLNALAQKPEIATERPDDPRAPLVLTPHPGEAARLLGTSIAEVQSDRLKAVTELARRFRAVAVLKGRHTLVSDPSGNVIINTSGNPGMATGGSGDTLTGILGGLLAQAVAPGRDADDLDAYRAATVPPLDVVATGIYLHGLAGDAAAAQVGEIGLVAGDLTAHLPAAIRLLEEQET